MIDEDFDYPTIGDFFSERGNCGYNVDEGESSDELTKQFETKGLADAQNLFKFQRKDK